MSMNFPDNEIISLLGILAALIVGHFMTHRLSNYPSVTAGSYVFISFVFSYLLAAGIFLMLRLDYDRSLFAASFVLCLFWYVLVYFLARRAVKLKYAVIPGGNSLSLLKIKHSSWTLLKNPNDYRASYGPVVVDLRHSHLPEWERFMADCALQGIPVYHTKQVNESLTGQVDIEHLSENTFGSLLPNMIYQRFKLAIDVTVAILVLPFVLIILAIISLAIFVTDGRPLFFTQERIGYRGDIFTLYKLRTMQNLSSDDNGFDKGAEIADAGRDDAMTKSDDTRITRLGAFLRKYRIDELPQIFNILKGEMSWIGPRPEAKILSNWYERELPFYNYRHIVRPGISGWAQVNQGHVAEMDEVHDKLHYDFFILRIFPPGLIF